MAGTESDPAELELARQLVENTQEDVRHIVTIADIDDPERIDIVVAAPWQFRALELARESDADNVIGEIMQEDEIRKQGDDAAKYGQELQQDRQSLPETLSPERERTALRRANWLFQREFDADVRLLAADEADDDVASKARPGRPAIHID